MRPLAGRTGARGGALRPGARTAATRTATTRTAATRKDATRPGVVRTAAVLLAAGAVLAGCSTSKDAVQSGQEFTFVAPGGQTTIPYDPPSSRSAVPGLTGESLLHEGATVGVADYPGKVVLVNIWGSWCGPCRTEAPELQSVAQQTGAVVLGINVRDSRAGAADFVRDRGLTYDSIFDNPGRVLAVLHGYPRNAVPSTIVLDKQHRVAVVYLTQVRVPELIPEIQRLQAEPDAAPAG